MMVSRDVVGHPTYVSAGVMVVFGCCQQSNMLSVMMLVQHSARMSETSRSRGIRCLDIASVSTNRMVCLVHVYAMSRHLIGVSVDWVPKWEVPIKSSCSYAFWIASNLHSDGFPLMAEYCCNIVSIQCSV